MTDTSSPAENRHSGGLFLHIPIVFIVAAVVATLFTAWTEPGLLPGGLADKFSQVLLPAEPTVSGDFPTPTARPLPRIGIVAGHSGNDPGAVCQPELGGVREVDINLDVANRVRTNLLNDGYEVDLLTEFDPRLAGYRAVALVSIHSDSCQYIDDQATGFKVAAALSSSYPEQATRLTNCIRSRYGKVTGLTFHAGSITPDMTKYHAFDEIDPQTPAAIIEVGFMNLDYQILTKQPDLVAQGVTEGILCYVRNEDVSSEATSTP